MIVIERHVVTYIYIIIDRTQEKQCNFILLSFDQRRSEANVIEPGRRKHFKLQSGFMYLYVYHYTELNMNCLHGVIASAYYYFFFLQILMASSTQISSYTVLTRFSVGTYSSGLKLTNGCLLPNTVSHKSFHTLLHFCKKISSVARSFFRN